MNIHLIIIFPSFFPLVFSTAEAGQAARFVRMLLIERVDSYGDVINSFISTIPPD